MCAVECVNDELTLTTNSVLYSTAHRGKRGWDGGRGGGDGRWGTWCTCTLVSNMSPCSIYHNAWNHHEHSYYTEPYAGNFCWTAACLNRFPPMTLLPLFVVPSPSTTTYTGSSGPCRTTLETLFSVTKSSPGLLSSRWLFCHLTFPSKIIVEKKKFFYLTKSMTLCFKMFLVQNTLTRFVPFEKTVKICLSSWKCSVCCL